MSLWPPSHCISDNPPPLLLNQRELQAVLHWETAISGLVSVPSPGTPMPPPGLAGSKQPAEVDLVGRRLQGWVECHLGCIDAWYQSDFGYEKDVLNKAKKQKEQAFLPQWMVEWVGRHQNLRNARTRGSIYIKCHGEQVDLQTWAVCGALRVVLVWAKSWAFKKAKWICLLDF